MSKKILVFAETREGNVRKVSYECLSAAHRIAEGGEIVAAVFDSNPSQQVTSLAQYGASQVYVVSNNQLDPYTAEAYTQAFTQLLSAVQPDVILIGHTALGKDLAPRVAARLGLGLVSDVTDISVDDGEVVFTRPIYAGKAFQKKKSVENTILATIRPNNIPMQEADVHRMANQVDFAADIRDLKTTIKEIVRKAANGVDLAEAKVVVSGGRGVKSAEGFDPLRELAEVLGGAVGASRGACDAEYCDYSLQIGQTGKVVTPDLYIACGISGAIQHVAGMSNAKVIVAINKDPEAPIFKIADYGIVGDLFEVIPLLTEEFKNMLNTKD
ncbi:electron transfer flavoprotein subunit alpha/FixB family protein [Paenibacillus sp. LMG 31460]|uniref:Electron transfer flavoprotein subunit alpha/FixB family protein n=1 Tax=Paenibacillus germinis TaxID=2654979 RepID=A0ABX1ZBV7_9BACL|nr:electron transfer flavoprotein subunit alpha/FixB family protein [Paenibacillus germinis]NOU89345.1 electron transfer flavoprotein subunit alpha/FixB family protein [Paenibacillus germinis]